MNSRKRSATLMEHCLAAMATWLGSAHFIFDPILENSTRSDIHTVVAWIVVDVSILILATPALARNKLMRHWFCWGDALSDRQHQALGHMDLRAFSLTGRADGYVSRALPYTKRFLGAMLVTFAIGCLLPGGNEPAPIPFAAITAIMLYLVVMNLPLAATLFACALAGRRS